MIHEPGSSKPAAHVPPLTPGWTGLSLHPFHFNLCMLAPRGTLENLKKKKKKTRSAQLSGVPERLKAEAKPTEAMMGGGGPLDLKDFKLPFLPE